VAVVGVEADGDGSAWTMPVGPVATGVTVSRVGAVSMDGLSAVVGAVVGSVGAG
jgi:hypothetical protein